MNEKILTCFRAPTADVLNVPNAKFLAHLAHQTQKRSFIRCSKWQKLYHIWTVPLQICNGMEKCCKNFIILYSLFSLLSLHFLSFLLSHSPVPSLFFIFSFLLSHSPVPSLFSLYRFPLSSDVYHQRRRHSSDDDCALRQARSRSSHSISRSATLQPRSISPITPRGRHRSHAQPRSSHSASLWLWGFFFFFWLIWWWRWAVGYGRWQWQWWWAVGVMALSSLFESMAICLFESVLNRCWIGGGLAFVWWLCLVIGICWCFFFFFPCFVGGFCLAGCVMVGWWWWLLPCWACVVVKWWLCRWWLVVVVATVVVGGCCCLVIGICLLLVAEIIYYFNV